MTFEVTVLGSNSAIPAHGRFPTSQVLTIQDKVYLLDCGEATQIRFGECYIKYGKINNIFISHLHGDHYFGLIGLINTFHLLKRDKPLHVYSPPGLEDIINIQLEYANTKLNYDLVCHPITFEDDVIFEDESITVEAISLDHRIPCSGFLFREKERLRKIIPEKIDEYAIPVEQLNAIKRGSDFITPSGKVIPHEEMTEAPPRPRSYAFLTDTKVQDALIPKLQGVDMLYHDTTFTKDAEQRAAETCHATGEQAAAFAKQAGVGQLLLGHFSAKYRDLTPLLEEAQAVFPNSALATGGKTFQVPPETT